MFWKKKFAPANTKKIGRRNFRKHRDIKNSEKYITWDISLKFGSLNKMKLKSSETKYYLGISGKGLITSMGLKTI